MSIKAFLKRFNHITKQTIFQSPPNTKRQSIETLPRFRLWPRPGPGVRTGKWRRRLNRAPSRQSPVLWPRSRLLLRNRRMPRFFLGSRNWSGLLLSDRNWSGLLLSDRRSLGSWLHHRRSFRTWNGHQRTLGSSWSCDRDDHWAWSRRRLLPSDRRSLGSLSSDRDDHWPWRLWSLGWRRSWNWSLWLITLLTDVGHSFVFWWRWRSHLEVAVRTRKQIWLNTPEQWVFFGDEKNGRPISTKAATLLTLFPPKWHYPLSHSPLP